MARTPLVAANWKMHLLAEEARAYTAALRAGLPIAGVEVALFPSFTLLPAVVAGVASAALEVEVGGQDLHPADSGAHTGDVSGAQLADAGCRWVLVGHSERRQNHGEDTKDGVARYAWLNRRGARSWLATGR